MSKKQLGKGKSKKRKLKKLESDITMEEDIYGLSNKKD